MGPFMKHSENIELANSPKQKYKEGSPQEEAQESKAEEAAEDKGKKKKSKANMADPTSMTTEQALDAYKTPLNREADTPSVTNISEPSGRKVQTGIVGPGTEGA